ncbi:uncharacterized protein LOC107272973 isoform X2 [Cephus cinctus]|uniref:Uncharacterized protein LOC107272973 isoform X2 n=1 Tax=Cephus cinctus TaxID=211228 RepID=A0AAJ7CAS6_CEPCN|nr:uncharacterized protein LOC107272973 isoform X2 [Cephus cinctus]
MASDNEASCVSDPNFAVICSFLECFGKSCGIEYPDIALLQEMLENVQEVPQPLVDLHIKLLRKTRKTVSPEKWERALVKFCHTYSNQDGWELERFGYKKARIGVKLRLLKVLLEAQFDLNQKFKNEVNKLAAEELRVEPLGRDKSGLAYWCQLDEECNIRVYREDLDEENWELVAKDREGVVSLISTLSNGEAGAIPINEDSNSLEISEKPIIDTGQVTTSPSLEEDLPQGNGISEQVEEEAERAKEESEDEDLEDDQQDEDPENDCDDGEDEEDDDDEDLTNEESSQPNTEEDDSQEAPESQIIESKETKISIATSVVVSKAPEEHLEKLSGKPAVEENPPSQHVDVIASTATVVKFAEFEKNLQCPKSSTIKLDVGDPTPLKSIETPVIRTSPLKLVNITDLTTQFEEKYMDLKPPVSALLPPTKKQILMDDPSDALKSLAKMSSKSNLPFSSMESTMVVHPKLSMKPIDQLAANLVKMQTEKLEKPSGAKSLEKIAENLARASSIVGTVSNVDEDRMPQDFCARGPVDKLVAHRSHRGMDLSTSPRGWETASDLSRPVDFSGIDLSSRKLSKPPDLPLAGYRSQDFQHREMDLSTRKPSKPEIPTLPAYDARAVMMHNHAMVTDLSKRQMSFTGYEMGSTYHASRISNKEEHRLPSYTILPDPSKITALRMGGPALKRSLDAEDAQQDILKRIRADVIPIRGTMDKRSLPSSNWRDEVGEAIEDPVMKVQGEGSGSDCDAVNPLFGEAIEEPVMFFYGEGSGQDCDTGNPGDETSTDNKESNESKNEACSSTSTNMSQNKLLTESSSALNEVTTESIVKNKPPIKINRNYQPTSVNTTESSETVVETSLLEKQKFKPTLGVQVFAKSVGGPVKRLSRWDVGRPDEKTECDSSIISNEGDISMKGNTNEIQCPNEEKESTGQSVTESTTEGEAIISTSSEDSKASVDTVNANLCTNITEQSDVTQSDTSGVTDTKGRSSADYDSTPQEEPTHCDSSMPSSNAGATEAVIQRSLTETSVESLINEHITEDALDSTKATSQKADDINPENAESTSMSPSPPRFFFGPNCISYTSKADESKCQVGEEATTSVDEKVTELPKVETEVLPVKSMENTTENETDNPPQHFNVSKNNNNLLKAVEPLSSETSGRFDNAEFVENKKTEVKEEENEQLISTQCQLTTKTSEGTDDAIKSMFEASGDVKLPDTKKDLAEELDLKNNSKSAESEVSDECLGSFSASKLYTPDNEDKLLKSSSDSEEDQNAQVEKSRSIGDLNARCKPVSSDIECQVTETKEEHLEEVSNTESPKPSKEEVVNVSEIDVEEGNSQAPCEALTEKPEDRKEPIDTTAIKSTAQNLSTGLSWLGESDSSNSGGTFESTSLPLHKNSERESTSVTEKDSPENVKGILEDSKKDTVDSSFEYEKSNVLSDLDAQDDQSGDTDADKLKGLAGSDADSISASYDKNSERNDTFSDLGTQDDRSRDSDEEKQKDLIDSGLSPESPEKESYTELLEESNIVDDKPTPQVDVKELPAFMSNKSDSVELVQDDPSVKSVNDSLLGEQGVNKAPVKEIYTNKVSPAVIMDSNISKSPERITIESKKEADSSGLIDSIDEYGDDVMDNRSSADQDSNEAMVIDDRLSDSNDSYKDVGTDDSTSNNEKKTLDFKDKLPTQDTLQKDKSGWSEDNDNCRRSDSFFRSFPTDSEGASLASGVANVVQTVTHVSVADESTKDSESTFEKSDEKDGNRLIKCNFITEHSSSASFECNDSAAQGKVESTASSFNINLKKTNESETVDTTEHHDIVQDIQSNAEAATVEKGNDFDKDSIEVESQDADNEQSLVADYDSNASDDDGSDDVFETDNTEKDQIDTDSPKEDKSILRLEDVSRQKLEIVNEKSQGEDQKSEVSEHSLIEPSSRERKEEPLVLETILNKEGVQNKETEIKNNQIPALAIEKEDFQEEDEKSFCKINETTQGEDEEDSSIVTSSADSLEKVTVSADATAIDPTKDESFDKSSDKEYPENLVSKPQERDLESKVQQEAKDEPFVIESASEIVKEDSKNIESIKEEEEKPLIEDLSTTEQSSLLENIKPLKPAPEDSEDFEGKESPKVEESSPSLNAVNKNKATTESTKRPIDSDEEESSKNEKLVSTYNAEDTAKTDNKGFFEDEEPIIQPSKRLKEDTGEITFNDKKLGVEAVNQFAEKLQQKEPTIELDTSLNHSMSSIPLVSQSIIEDPSKLQSGEKDISIRSQQEPCKPLAVAQQASDNISMEQEEKLEGFHEDKIKEGASNLMTRDVKSLLMEHPSVIIDNSAKVAIVQEMITAQPTHVIKDDNRKEASKRLGDISTVDDLPPFKSKPSSISPTIENTPASLRDTSLSFTNRGFGVSNEFVKIPTEGSVAETISSQVLETGKMKTDVYGKVPAEAVSLEKSNADTKKDSSEVQSIDVKDVDMESDDSMGVDNDENVFNEVSEDADPLACTEGNVTGWKLDGTETPKVSRKRRNSTHESNSEDVTMKQDADEEEMMGGKRIKLRGKRLPDMRLRKSVEDSRVGPASSEDEAVKSTSLDIVEEDTKETNEDATAADISAAEKKTRGRPKGRRRRGLKSGSRALRAKATDRTPSASETPELAPDSTPISDAAMETPTGAQKKRKKRKMVLGLEIGRDIVVPDASGGLGPNEPPVRQSRRIAQLKIKEEADRRRIEEETLSELKEKKDRDSTEKKKRKKQKAESDEDIVVKDIERESKIKKKWKKKKKKKMASKFNEAHPWQTSSGSSSDEDDDNDDDDDEDEEIESEGSLLFKSDHEFSPESDLEKDEESEPLRRARTAQKAQSDDEEADDEYACQKCGKADHPEWILLCDTCDKGWHCSCLRPALMLIPEGDWFCPPCQHNLLVTKLQESLKKFDQTTKRHENEILRKKRLAFVGISLDNVLHKSEAQRSHKESRTSSQESDNDSSSSSSVSSSGSSSSGESEPVYQLRERRCANTYKFNEYDDMINAAIQDEVEAVQGAGNQGRGKDIATIVNAEKEEAQAEALKKKQLEDEEEESKRKSEKDSDEDYKAEKDDDFDEEEEEERKMTARKLLARKKHRKLNSLDISSEDDPESDVDFKGSSSDDDEDLEDQSTSSDDSCFAETRRRGKKGDSRPVRRSTRARMTRYDEDFINDDSDDSDRPKRKKSKSAWDESESEDSDNSWRQKKKKSKTIQPSRIRTLSKTKSKKKKKRKRIIESDNHSENDEEDEPKMEDPEESEELEVPSQLDIEPGYEPKDNEATTIEEHKTEDEKPPLEPSGEAVAPFFEEEKPKKKKKENTPKQKKVPAIRRKIIYGGLPDDSPRQEEETLSRRTRGRKINYQEVLASDSEEELKKALRKTEESEDEFVVNEAEDLNEDAEKDSDSGDIYSPKKESLKPKNKSPKTKRPKGSKSPATKGKGMSEDEPPKQRKKPGPKPGSKNKPRQPKLTIMPLMNPKGEDDGVRMMGADKIGNTDEGVAAKVDEAVREGIPVAGTVMSGAGPIAGEVAEGSLTGLGPGELEELDEEQLEQMMMEDEEYGRRQLELAAIEIAKKKKKEEREAKKLEKARLKALEILAAERQRDPNAPEGTDGEAPKKKKRGRRSKAEILAEQMRRDGAPNLGPTALGSTISPNITPSMTPNMTPNINPNLPAVMTPETERTTEGHIPIMTGPDGQLFNPDGSPMKPKRRGRGKGKKTLALEAARAAEAAAKAAAEGGLIGMGTDSNSEAKPDDIPNVLPTPGSSTSGSAPSTPPANVVPTQGQPSGQPTNPQPVYPSLPPSQQSSVITRMLQSQPVSSSPQSFTAAAAAMGHKYFGAPNAAGQMMGGPRSSYDMQPRGRIPSPYRQPGQSPMPPHFAAVRSGTPPMRMRVPGPQMYHTPHHPMDPSPSGGGPISINSRDRSSPLGPGPAMIPPAAGSPLAKGGPTPPPPPYVRGGPPLARFPDNSPMGPRHQIPPFSSASPANHSIQQASPPPNRPPGNFSPYHPPPPPNYHYGAYPPPPPMSTADDAAAYQGSPYPAEHFSTPAENPAPIQAPPPPQPQPPQPQPHPSEAANSNKQYDEEGSGEFGGLVSYFSSQREDDLDS